jgi:type VI secretion system secreted protein Hcp
MARSDMFLKATGARTGEIVGETSDKRFPGQIDVVDFSWGMTAPSAVGGMRTGRMLVKELQIVKRVDKASTALMSVMTNNELLTTVVLSVRKAGGAIPLPYFVATVEKARIIGYDLHSDIGSDGGPTLTETIQLAFKSVTFDHTVQSETGASLGASSVVVSVDPNA